MVARQPNGLPAPGQVVSAYDLALIARQALAMPAFMKYDSTLTARFPIKRHKQVTMVNQDYLLTRFRGGIGGKIGWTEKAEATYIGLARRHGVTLIVTILHATPLTEITSAERLLNWGFAMPARSARSACWCRRWPPAARRPSRKSGRSGRRRPLAGTARQAARRPEAVHAGRRCRGRTVRRPSLAGLAWLRRRMLHSRHQAS